MKNEHTEGGVRAIDLSVLLSDLLQAARRFLWLGVLLVLLCTGILSFRTYWNYVPQYEASASFTVNVTNPLQAEVRSYNAATAEQMAKTFPYILTSGALYDLVIRELNLTTMPVITAGVLENTNIFSLSVRSGDPRLSYNVLNAVIAYYPAVAEFVVGPTSMTLLDETGVPQSPVNSRNYRSAVKKGTLLGLGLWLVLLAIFSMRRSTIHNEDELKNILNLPCVGQLPLVKASRRAEKETACPLLTKENDRYGFAESVRLLRIRGEKELSQREMKVLLVSSAIAGEGKTTVAANLALSLAQKGCRVLLMDCDLRNPSVADAFGMEKAPGLVAYLKKKISASEIARPTDVKGLFVVLGGKPVRNAAELLARKEISEWIEQIKPVFDYVILDTPPCSLLADASELAGLADGALLVVRQNYASRDQIMEGAQMLSDSGLPLLGCVINGASTGIIGSAYGGYYGYGYSRYGYGEYTEKKEK